MMRILVLALALAACGAPEAPEETAPPAPSAADEGPEGWDVRVTQYLPQIDACVGASPQAHNINYVGEHDGGVLVRMSGEDGDMDCRVVDGVAQIAPRDASLSVAGEGAAIFVRGPGANPGGACYVAPEVRDANGELVGWWLDPEGC